MIDLAAYSVTLPIVLKINELHQQIESLRPISAEQEHRILQKYRLDWNYHSNAIEGNSLTYGETRAFLMHGLTAKGKPLKDHLDIRGHNKAIDFLYQMLKEESEITETDIRSLHEVILVEPYEVDTKTEDGIPAKKRIQLGKYKTSPNHVLTQTGEIHYYATPEETPILMGELMETYRQNKTNTQVHPYILAAYFHYRFTAIHPFDDGNGRMARLMMNLLLMKAGYPPVIIRQEKASREAYYYALSQADVGEFVPFFELIGEALVHSMELYVKGAKGESLEEPDDLDKELALLKRELETQGRKSNEIHTKENQFKVYLATIKPLDEELKKLFQKFRDFFLKYDKRVGENSHLKKVFKTSISPSSFNDSLLSSFEFNYTFTDFKDKACPFGVSWIVKIKFTTYDYEVHIRGAYSLGIKGGDLKEITENQYQSSSFFGSPILFTLPYGDSFTPDDINKISAEIGKSFLNAIKQLQKKYLDIKIFNDSH